jgi:drug/metabolite transporter (DMT)-like permease
MLSRYESRRQTLGYALAALSGCLLSTLGVLGKTAYALGADPLSVVSLRATIAGIILGIAVMATKPNLFRLRASDLPFFVGYGFVGVALNYLGYFYALEFTTVATAITVLYTYPAMVVVLAFIIYREPIARLKIVALLSCLLGVVLVASGSSSPGLTSDPRGLILSLLAGASTAVYIVAGKRVLAEYDARTALFFSFLFGSLALNVLRYVELGPGLNTSMEIMLVIVAIAVVPTLLGYGLLTYSLRLIEAGRAAIVSSIEPAISIYLAYLFLHETPNLTQLAGSVLVIIGALLIGFSKVPEKQRGR